MAVQSPLDFNFLLVHDYIYSMNVVVSTLLRVMHLPNNRNIVTIDQLLSVINNCTIFAHPISLSVPNVQAFSFNPWTHYVASYLRHSISNEKEPLTSCLASLDLDLAVDLVSPSIGALESNLPPIGPSGCSFQDFFLPFDEDLLEDIISVGIPLVSFSIVDITLVSCFSSR